MHNKLGYDPAVLVVMQAPLDGSLRTLVDFVDFHAEYNPDLPWLVHPSTNQDGTLQPITFRRMAAATHRIANTLRSGRQGPDDEVFAILLHTDNVVYVAVLVGLMRAGFIPFPMSPRNSTEGISHLLRTSGCQRILHNSTTAAQTQQACAKMDEEGAQLRLEDLSVLQDILSDLITNTPCSQTHEVYSRAAKPVELSAPLLYIHSSGSTGLPKTVPFKHELVVQNLRKSIFGSGRRKIRFGGMALPTFHAMGMLVQAFFPLASLQPVAVYAPRFPDPPETPNPASVLQLCKLAQCEGLIAAPSFIETWSHDPDAIAYLRTLDVVLFGGGPLSNEVGDKLAADGVPLHAGYGGGEFGNPIVSWDEVSSAALRSPDWKWYRFSAEPDVRMIPQGDGTYELVIYETDEFKVRKSNLPAENGFVGYATADLFEQHPTKHDLWRIVGRKDDVIILGTGEKIVPLTQEGVVLSSPLVAGCVMFGREREQAGILVELSAGHAVEASDLPALARARNELWPIVEQANATAPAFARIFKEMILVAKCDRPLPRTPKNTIMRKAATALYSAEINNLYSTVESSRQVHGVAPPRDWNEEMLAPWLLDLAGSVSAEHTLNPDEDVFQQGFDSLSATFLRNRIVGALRVSTNPAVRSAARKISSNFIFDHPTMRSLAAALTSLTSPELATKLPIAARQAEIDSLVARFTADMPTIGAAVKPVAEGVPVILLTGSTGNNGSHILAGLLSEPRIARVYALNRPSEASCKARLEAAFAKRLLPLELLDDARLVCLDGEVSTYQFGLDKTVYDEVMGSVTHIIHNAWTVNFNLPLRSFEDQISGIRKLIDANVSSQRHIRLLVTSSIGVARGWHASQGPVPERTLAVVDAEKLSGYAASKFIVEKIMEAARERGLAATTVRMGQACGPRSTGAWSASEWFPILVRSSVALGCLPELSGPVAWVPLDAIARNYVEWVLAEGALPALVNLVHPRPTTWNAVLQNVRAELGGELPMVSFSEWLARLDSRGEGASRDDLEDLPALQLLGFFRAFARSDAGTATVDGPLGAAFDTEVLVRSSTTMHDLAPLSEAYARAWVKFWSEQQSGR
ncbi:acetyl-CoA synthetase-like protein [Phanerochaete sordida]|uniref:Acetyl-CoA synthetase-like protein n=1 Tax=Phanerochaete sordida TaxID=48140 RepID=A0A9P3GLB0_9APHY|nr:acetyl-CoA synthetase-like protein [Phanerochaete sordida]